MDSRMPLAVAGVSACVDRPSQCEALAVTEVAFAAEGADPACSQEPIHIPGSIQPHGALLAIDPVYNWTVVAASRNAVDLLKLTPSMGGLIGRDFANLLGQSFATAVRRRFHGNTLRGAAPWHSTLRVAASATALDVAVHCHAGLVLVELEPTDAEADSEAKAVIRQLQQSIVTLRETGSDRKRALTAAVLVRAG